MIFDNRVCDLPSRVTPGLHPGFPIRTRSRERVRLAEFFSRRPEQLSFADYRLPGTVSQTPVPVLTGAAS